MTLLEMSVLYGQSADQLRSRISTLRAQARQQSDPDARRQLCQRIRDLTPLLRESRELAALTAHYYERGYSRHARYRL